MWPDRVSNPGPLTYESGALPIALHGPAVLTGKPEQMLQTQIKARGYKTFFMLNSVEHKILIALKYEDIKKFNNFQAQISLECYLSCS